HPLAAPLRADLTGLPPVLILLAELDVLRSEGEALAAKLREAAVPVEMEIYQGVLHGFLRATDSVQKSRDAVARAGAWLRRIAHSLCINPVAPQSGTCRSAEAVTSWTAWMRHGLLNAASLQRMLYEALDHSDDMVLVLEQTGTRAEDLVVVSANDAFC